MDYIEYKLLHYLCIFWTIIPYIYCHYDRDIILTPYRSKEYAGKMIYFSPMDIDIFVKDKENQTAQIASSSSLWEAPLKHVIYLMLNNKIDGNFNSSDIIKKELVTRAEYLKKGDHQINTHQFGDIIPLANGWIERTNQNKLIFIEMDHHICKKNCTFDEAPKHNVTAFWLVERIRHRDQERGHRYELRLTVFPVKKTRFENSSDKRDAGQFKMRARSFLIRDNDYPELFDLKSTDSDSNKIQKRTFTHIFGFPLHPPPSFEHYDDDVPFAINTYPGPFPEDLNTGEYYQPPLPYSNRGPFNVDHLGTVEPSKSHDMIRFPTSKSRIQGQASGPMTTTHLHHHYYLKNNVPVAKLSTYEKENVYQGLIKTFQPNFNQQRSNGNRQTIANDVNKLQNPGLASTEPNQPLHQTPYTVVDQLPSPPAQGPSHPATIAIQPLMYPFFSFIQPNIADIYSQQSQRQPSQPPVHGQIMELVTIDPYAARPILTPTAVDVNPRYIHRPIIVNEIPAPEDGLGKFKSNPQFEKYSEKDPVYHSEKPILVTPVPNPNKKNPIDQDHHLENQEYNTTPFEISTKAIDRQKLENPQKAYILNARKANYEIGIEHSTEPIDDDQNYTDNAQYPDSINAQLPPPDHEDDLTVPYVESSVVKENTVSPSRSFLTTSTESQENIVHFSRSPNLPSGLVQTNPVTRTLNHLDKTKRGRQRFYPKSTTEKPILKWMPKRARIHEGQNGTSSTTLEPLSTTINETSEAHPTSITTTTTDENVITVTPINYNIEEPRTSISTSISIHVGQKSTDTTTKEDALITTTQETLLSTDRDQDYDQNQIHVQTQVLDQNRFLDQNQVLNRNQAIDQNLVHDQTQDLSRNQVLDQNQDRDQDLDQNNQYSNFIPTVIPTENTIETIKGHLETILTNSSTLRLYQASEGPIKGVVDDRIAASIVDHARNLH